MKKIFFFFFISIIGYVSSFAQQATIKGTIFNGKSKETIPGVNVIINANTGVVSDIDGMYSIKVDPGKVTVTYKYIGFTTVVNTYDLKPGQTKMEDIQLYEESMVIEGIVVSAGKFELKLSDVTISMAVLKQDQIEKKIQII